MDPVMLEKLAFDVYHANRPAFVQMAQGGYSAEGRGALILQFDSQGRSGLPDYRPEAQAPETGRERIERYDARRELVLCAECEGAKSVQTIQFM